MDRSENSEKRPEISESPLEFSSPLNISLDIPYSSSSDSDESSDGDNNNEYESIDGDNNNEYEDQYEAAEVDESQQLVPTKKRRFEELQNKYSEDDDTQPSKVEETNDDDYSELLKETGYESEDHDEQLFDEKERISYKTFRRQQIFGHYPAISSPPAPARNPPSPFMNYGNYNNVNEKFERLVEEFPGEIDDVAYLRLRNDANEITIALSKEEILELLKLDPFWASAQHIDFYLYCRLKLFPTEIQERVHRCSAYMISLNMHDLSDWKDATPFYILEDALRSEMKEVDFNIIPLLYGSHWTLAIVCGLGSQRNANLPGVPWPTPCILHFNSLQGLGIRTSHIYAISRAVANKSGIDVNLVAWHEILSPQQQNALDCGFYVMRFAVEFLKNANSPQPLSVHDLFHILGHSISGNTKAKLAKFGPKARYQLKGFLGSVNRDEREWIIEFSEGKPCTIDILPYCFPFYIMEADTYECQVEMLNKVRPVYVPTSYVIEHWRDIYDDFIQWRDRPQDDSNERRDGAED